MAAAAVTAAKRELRSAVRRQLAALGPAAVAEQSAAVMRRLAEDVPEVAAARALCVFLSMTAAPEVQTSALVAASLARGAAVFVPVVTGARRDDMALVRVADAADLASFPLNAWGIPEPSLLDATTGASRVRAEASEPPVSVVVVPGLAFDARGRRCGHGRGYFDTWLRAVTAAHVARSEPRPLFVGVCLEPQLVAAVPTGPEDVTVDCVVTPSATLRPDAEPAARAVA
jgi:5-formyltetrahydrofolate cyclo-ligase